jgi:hypothetical protein
MASGPRVLAAQVVLHLADGRTVTYTVHEPAGTMVRGRGVPVDDANHGAADGPRHFTISFTWRNGHAR